MELERLFHSRYCEFTIIEYHLQDYDISWQKHHFLQIRFDTQAVCIVEPFQEWHLFAEPCMKQKDARGRFLGTKKPEKKCSHCLSRNNYWAFLEIFFSNKVVAKVVRGMNWGTTLKLCSQISCCSIFLFLQHCMIFSSFPIFKDDDDESIRK